MATVSLQTLGYHWEIPAVCPAFPFCGQLGFIPRWVSTQDHGQPTLVSKGSVWLPSPLDSCLGHGGGCRKRRHSWMDALPPVFALHLPVGIVAVGGRLDWVSTWSC